MKVKIAKESLLQGIMTVQNIVSSRATLPILSNMLLDTRRDIIKLNTTDLDIGISCELPVETIEEGAITIPAKRFSDIVKELPAGDILITVKKNNQIDIEGQKCRFKLIGLPKEEFPKFPEFKNKTAAKIEQKVFKEMIRMTQFAVSHEEARYVLNGILIQIEEKQIRMVATDGRRLAKIEKEIEAAAQENLSVIIPIKAIQEIYRNLKDVGYISIVAGLNQVLFDIEGTLIASRIIEGEFPNYDQVIPKTPGQKIMLSTQLLLSAIRRANLLATPDFQAIKFEVFSDKLVVSKTTPNVGESREEVEIDYKGKEMVVGFNPLFLIDVLKNVEEESVSLELLGPDKAGIIRLEDYLYLALPMRI